MVRGDRLEVLSGIYRLEIPIPNNPLGSTNIYLIRGTNGDALIDSGWPNQSAFDALKQALVDSGSTVQNIRTVILTHGHRDHIGLAAVIKDASGATIVRHESEGFYSKSEGWDIVTRTWWDWLQSNGLPEHDVLDLKGRDWEVDIFQWRIDPDVMVKDGDHITAGDLDLEVIWTPGHSYGHMCLYDAAHKVLFSGDHVLPVITPHVSADPRSPAYPLAHFISSLKKLVHYDVRLVLPGHQQNFSNLQQRIDEIIQHHDDRLNELLTVLDNEEKTAFDISCLMSWTGMDGITTWGIDLPSQQQMGAIGETLAHLELLEQEKVVEKVPRNSLIYYRSTGAPARQRWTT